MQNIKKLWKRDRIYWLILTVILLVAMGYTISREWSFSIDTYVNGLNHYKENWGQPGYETIYPGYETIYNYHNGDISKVYDPLSLVLDMSITFFYVVFFGMTIKCVLQETKKRREVQKVLPMQYKWRMGYDYVSGLVFLAAAFVLQAVLVKVAFAYVEKETGINCMTWNYFLPFYGKTAIALLTEYSLVCVCVKITNHIPAAAATYGLLKVACTTLLQLGRWPLGTIWCIEMMIRQYMYPDSDMHDYGNPMIWVWMAAVAVVLILLIILAERKKDLAVGGFYAFRTVQWIMLGILFFCLACWFRETGYLFTSKVIVWLYTIVPSAGFTVGAYFLTRAKKG